MNQERLVREIEAALSQLDSRIKFDVVITGVRKDNDWWYVPIIPEMADGRLAARDFTVNILAGIESKIHERFDENVLFIPATR